MPLSPQAFSAPSRQMHGSNPKGDLNSIAFINASSTISIPSSEPSASKPRDSKLKREAQTRTKPRYRRHNGSPLSTRHRRSRYPRPSPRPQSRVTPSSNEKLKREAQTRTKSTLQAP